ncbi:MAG TPA: NAD-dependent epimerase/dehydratase family protein [Bacteroidia bacterium]|jgi:UDP-glucuronate decarboxylase|nr:NAD-dependent epimerase/dehydratase family protein [Bacteroidia bacterium]
MNRILVTGGAGFIGSSVAEKLAADKDNHVVIIDDLTTGSFNKIPESPHKNVRFIKCDVNDWMDVSGIMYSQPFDYVFHYAAVVGVNRTLENPVKVLNDLSGIRHLLYLAKNSGVKRVYFSSSSEVYGESFHFPQHEETTPLNSRLPYAIVKNASESYLKAFQQEYGLEYTIFRFFNTYGPRQTKDFVVSKFIAKALKNEPIELYGGGTQTRTFCYIDDNVDACLNAFKQNLYINDVVNIGGEDEVPIIDLAKLIIKLTNSSSKIINLPPLPEGDMTRRKPDLTRMKKLLSRNHLTLEEGLKNILNNTKFIL